MASPTPPIEDQTRNRASALARIELATFHGVGHTHLSHNGQGRASFLNKEFSLKSNNILTNQEFVSSTFEPNKISNVEKT